MKRPLSVKPYQNLFHFRMKKDLKGVTMGGTLSWSSLREKSSPPAGKTPDPWGRVPGSSCRSMGSGLSVLNDTLLSQMKGTVLTLYSNVHYVPEDKMQASHKSKRQKNQAGHPTNQTSRDTVFLKRDYQENLKCKLVLILT
jgi:hypothetical protein